MTKLIKLQGHPPACIPALRRDLPIYMYGDLFVGQKGFNRWHNEHTSWVAYTASGDRVAIERTRKRLLKLLDERGD